MRKTEKIAANWLLIGGSFVLIVLLQWGHFSWYFGQPVWLGLFWSVIDWAVWFALAIAYFVSGRRVPEAGRLKLCLLSAFILLAGPLQIAITTVIYDLILGSSRSFVDSFLHLMNKRWLLNLFIAFVLINAFRKVLFPATHGIDHLAGKEKKLMLRDGNKTYLVPLDEISALVAERNYVEVKTPGEDRFIRASLTSLETQISDPRFLRVNRSVIINTDLVDRFEKYSRTGHKVFLTTGDCFNVSRDRYPDIIKRIAHPNIVTVHPN